MNYLFYLGIILPTLITICLFLVFIYCWFLQKARKEVLTRRYDPHGKMRRLGMSMDPPPPPDFCRLEATAATPLAAHLSPAHYGEDNMAYCVSRSPSTDQQQQQQHGASQPARRSLYHTYHDSGISAGGLATLTDSVQADCHQRNGVQDLDLDSGRPEGGRGGGGGGGAGGSGLSYRTCPDSGISGLSGGFYLPGDSAGLSIAACPQPACHLHDQHQHQQIYYEDQYHQHQHQQQQQQMRPQHLHHTLVQASVHPSHGVCYGDDTNHPQSPQHYGSPPQYHLLQQQQQQQQQQLYNHHHHHQQQSPQRDSRVGHLQQLQMAAQIHYPPSSVHTELPTPSSVHKELPTPSSARRCSQDIQVFELVSPTATRPKDFHGRTTETSFGPQGALDIMVTSSSDPRLANISLPAQQSIVLSCLVQQQQKQDQQLLQLESPTVHHQHLQQQLYQQQQHHRPHDPAKNKTLPDLKATVPTGSKAPLPPHHRDSGIPEEAGGSGGSNNSSSSSTDQSSGSNNSSSSSSNSTITSNTSSERPDSQASHSPSTTDSEDSGFRGSHCPNSAPAPVSDTALTPAPSSRLNKQTNPLLKPLRRPRNKGARKSATGQGSSSAVHAKSRGPASTSSSSPPWRGVSTIANTDSSAPGSPTPLITLDPQNLTPTTIGDGAGLGSGLEMIDMAGRGGPTSMRTPDSSPHRSPSAYPREGGGASSSTSGASGGVAVGDISTHLSWNYLQGLSSGQSGGGGTVPHLERIVEAGVVSDQGGGARQLRQDLHHMDVLGYSVV